MPKAVEDARYISFSGKTNGLLENGFKDNPLAKINGNIDGELKSGFGDAVLNITKTPENLNAKIDTDNLQLGKILNDGRFNIVSANLETCFAPVFTWQWRSAREPPRPGVEGRSEAL